MSLSDGTTLDKLDGIQFGIDNGCYASTWTPKMWLRHIEKYRPLQDQVMFAVVPDLVADAPGTRVRWERWGPVVRGLGYRTAYVAQNDVDLDDVPWDEIDVWFTGGTTAWKLSEEAAVAMERARSLGKWTHMGRVNSLRRLRFAAAQGYDSVDGTYVTYSPDVNLGDLLGWLDLIEQQPVDWTFDGNKLIKHGEYAGYRAGCRLPCCREANNRYMKVFRSAA